MHAKEPSLQNGHKGQGRKKFAALHRRLWPLKMSEKFSHGTENSNQTNNFEKYIYEPDDSLQ